MPPRRPDRPRSAEADAVEQAWQIELTALDAEPAEPEPTDLPSVLPGEWLESEPAGEFDFAERLRTAPDRPGCYLMKDRHGQVVYVGKASSLRARLRQYASGQDERFFVHLLHQIGRAHV